MGERAKRRYSRDRGAHRRRKPKGAAPARHRPTERHPLFGEIPLIEEETVGLLGRVVSWWRYDPDYEPPLPRGAVRGNVRKQAFCSAHHVPKYFYLDETRTCVQCGAPFTFRAAEQKHWYETLQFNFASVPIRCLTCRRQRRSEHAMREQIARAKADVRAHAGDPASHLSLARAVVEYHQRTGQGDLNEAIAAARKAADLWPKSSEPLFWEGVAHKRAGREATARARLDAFIRKAPPRLAALKRRAAELLKGAEADAPAPTQRGALKPSVKRPAAGR